MRRGASSIVFSTRWNSATWPIPPGNRLEALKGDRAGFFSIRVNDQFRIVFRFDRGDAREVEIVDYH
jgi:plasmid maintenance system killer protein